MDIVEILTNAKELISPPDAWTQGWFAKTASEDDTGFDDQNAVCFCAYGAIYRAAGIQSSAHMDDDIKASPEVVQIRSLLLTAIGGNVPSDVAEFNDTHSHDEVLAAFDRAIALAKAEA